MEKSIFFTLNLCVYVVLKQNKCAFLLRLNGNLLYLQAVGKLTVIHKPYDSKKSIIRFGVFFQSNSTNVASFFGMEKAA